MGKRQIGELEPTELVLTLLISDLAAVPMQDFGIPLLSGGAIPLHSLGKRLLHALAIAITNTKQTLPFRIALFSSLTIPPRRLGIVLCDAQATIVATA